ncbi:unnamed protein product [Cuscuta campestris]|uniref:Phosphoglycerate kinase n=1 Tax=Cuscuta campestris TaxID=132261 RepID=A0A484L8Y8_9ASTE|nr:unnamed protein product [Cuscuta campestris]
MLSNMNQVAVDIPHPVHTFFNKPCNIIPSPLSRSHRTRNRSAFNKNNCSAHLRSPFPDRKTVDEPSLVEEDAVSDGGQLPAFPHIRSLGNFPREELFGKVVMVRFDKMVILDGMRKNQPLPASSFSTIKYLYESGAKVILVSSWNEIINPMLHSKAHLSSESVAEFLSSMLEVEVVTVKLVCGYMLLDMGDSTTPHICLLENLFHCKGERANSSKLSKELTSGVDIVINDAFSESHKVLASTVGVASFCCAHIAGFYFDEGLCKLKKIIKPFERPYVAIIGGSSLAEKADAVHLLASICDGLVFVGSMAFQIMHALGIPVPLKLVEHGALNEAVRIVKSAILRNIPLGLPQDVWCIKENFPHEMEMVSVHSIPEGWQPVDIGPGSLEKMISLLSKCKVLINL